MISTSQLLRLAGITAALSLLIILGGRLLLPGNVYIKDQPKTMAYTVDIVKNGRWSLPRDVLSQPATKPPLYNWIDAIFVHITGSYEEWVFKLPSMIAGVGIMVLIVWAARRALLPSIDKQFATFIGLFAAAIFIANPPVLSLIYLARPDLLQAAFLSAAWVAGTMALSRQESNLLPALTFWLCLLGVALSKGPAALIALVWAPLAAKLLYGSWRHVYRLLPLIGLPILLGGVGVWFAAVWRVDPDHLWNVLIKGEIIQRAVEGGPEGNVVGRPFYYAPMWFMTKFLPWSLPAALGVLIVARRGRKFASHPLAAAALWLIVLLISFSIPQGKRIDYLVPCYVPAAILAAWVMTHIARRLRLPMQLVLAAVPLFAGWSIYRFPLTETAEYTTRLKEFARDVRAAVPHDEPVLVLVRGKNPIGSLLGQHPGSYLSPQQLKDAKWAVVVQRPEYGPPVVASRQTVTIDFATQTPDKIRGIVALHRLDQPGAPTLEHLTADAKALADWGPAENPYRTPGTIWRDAP